MKNVCSPKTMSRGEKVSCRLGESICKKDTSYKGLLSKTYKKIFQEKLSNKKTIQLKNGPKILTATSPKIYR